MRKEDCVFCKIVEGKLPCYKVYEDDKIISFLDITPYAIGHIMVVPKEHSKWLWDVPIDEYNPLMEKCHYLANVLRRAFSTEWVEEVVAGIGVEHTHVHLLPRKRDDGLGEIPTKPLANKPTKEEMEMIRDKIIGNQ
jgi:histidine triad (HIT) family protein